MSLARLIYYSALMAGWGAFAAALLAEFLVRSGIWQATGSLNVALKGTCVGALVGAALNCVAGMTNGQWRQQVLRLLPGLGIGAVAGGIGGWLGNELAGLFPLGVLVGWVVLGVGVGIVEGLSERSWRKIRNGLIGGALGGLAGGLLKEASSLVLTSGTGLASRVTAFVLLGICVGLLVGLVQVALKEAWLTVLDGYRPGRQLILSQEATILGRSEFAALPFLGSGNRDVEPEHVRIRRLPDGTYLLENLHGSPNVRLNQTPLTGSAPLRHGDIIRIAGNAIRFEERERTQVPPPGESSAPVVASTPTPVQASSPVTPVTPTSNPATRRPEVPRPQPEARKPSCPGCPDNAPGPVGKRRCLICTRTF